MISPLFTLQTYKCTIESRKWLYSLVLFTTIITHSQYHAQSWNQMGADIHGEIAGSHSGFATSLNADGTILAIGAPYNSENSFYAGHVRVMQFANNTWNQLGEDIDGTANVGRFGWSVSLNNSGLILAVGAPINPGNDTLAGQVRVYAFVDDAWTQMGATINGDSHDEQSGSSVSLSADGLTVAIGAPHNNDTELYIGQVRVFHYEGDAWNQMGGDINSYTLFDATGHSVSLSDDGLTLAIGAPSNYTDGNYAGHVVVYQYNNNAWEQLGIPIDGISADARAGFSISLSADGTTLALGAPSIPSGGTGTSGGYAAVYSRIDEEWVQQGNIILGDQVDDHFGSSVSLSADGTRLVVGAKYNEDNGFWAGHVRTFDYINGVWVQLGSTIVGAASSDESGASVSISSDGNVIAIGSPRNEGYTGEVRAYSLLPLGIVENKLEHPILVYPNPTRGKFTIDLGIQYKNLEVALLTIDGRVIHSDKLVNTSQVSLTIEQPIGFYLVRINSEGNHALIRIKKE